MKLFPSIAINITKAFFEMLTNNNKQTDKYLNEASNRMELLKNKLVQLNNGYLEKKQAFVGRVSFFL